MNNDEKIIERLDRLVDGIDKIVAAIPKPASRIQRIFDALATFATVAGLLSINPGNNSVDRRLKYGYVAFFKHIAPCYWYYVILYIILHKKTRLVMVNAGETG